MKEDKSTGSDLQQPGTNAAPLPYRSHSSYLRERFGEKVHRLSLDAGFSCPHREGGRGTGGCSYCDSRGSGTGAFDAGSSVTGQAEAAVRRLSRAGVKRYIAYFQAFSGTAAPIGSLKALYREAAALPGVVGLTVATRPDALPDRVLDLLAGFGPGGSEGLDLDVWVEIGLQSAHDRTLERINRRHDVACFDDAVRRAAKAGLSTAAHVILGLPGEDETDILRTAIHLAGLPLKGVKLHHLYITRDAPFAEAWQRGEIASLSLDQYIPLAAAFLRRLDPDMVVMRLCGSPPSGSRSEKSKLLAPLWNATSSQVASGIAAMMTERGFRQGDLFNRDEPSNHER